MGLPCEILAISQGRERAEEGVFWGSAPTQPSPLRRGGVPPGPPGDAESSSGFLNLMRMGTLPF
jgi:hypothetical protein